MPKRPASQWIVKDISEPASKVAKNDDSAVVAPSSKANATASGTKKSAVSETKTAAPIPASTSPYELYQKALASDDKTTASDLLRKAISLLSASKATKTSRSRLISPRLNPAFLSHRCLCELARRCHHDAAKPLLEKAAEAFPVGTEPYERLGNLLLFRAETMEDLKDVCALLNRSVELGRDLAEGTMAEDAEEALEKSDDPEALEAELDEHEEQEFAHASSAAQKLALLYCANPSLDTKGLKARKLLKGLNYTYKLGKEVLAYPLPPPAKAMEGSKDADPYVRVLDGVLPDEAIDFLSELFGAESDFWSSHQYNPFVSNGYFSYLERLNDSKKKPMFAAILGHLSKLAAQLFPDLASARPMQEVEWWAHTRPHVAGHQLHFDSENEGITPLCDAGSAAPRHPVVSCVIYLSDGDVGGPTMVTTQTLASKELDSVRGWHACGKRGMVTFFDSSMLHGVIPGRGVVADPATNRRTTFMLGLWDVVTEQAPPLDGKLGGASQKFPPESGKGMKWVDMIEKRPAAAFKSFKESEIAAMGVPAVPIDKVWEPVDDSKKVPKGLIPYEDCFQGF